MSSPFVLGVCALGILLRLLCALQGNNYDMESWWIASQGILDGRAVYETTFRYNYGPIWAYTLATLRHISAWLGFDSITALHLLITLFLSLIDCALTLIVLTRSSSPSHAILFLLNPVSIMVSGYHVQFDNFAILLGLLAWALFLSASTTWRIIVAALLFGASLTTKHVFLIFIPWILFARWSQTVRTRILFCAISLVIFFGSFVPFMADPASAQGIRDNVFGYISTEGHSLINALNPSGNLLPDRSLFLFLLSALGVFIGTKHRNATELPLVYLCALTALSSGMARNYLAIPLIAVFLWIRNPFAILYVVVSTIILLTRNNALGTPEVTLALSNSPLLSYELAQILLLLLLATRLRVR